MNKSDNSDKKQESQELGKRTQVEMSKLIPKISMPEIPMTVKQSAAQLSAAFDSVDKNLSTHQFRQISALMNNLTSELDSVWGNQLRQLQNSMNELQNVLEYSGINQMANTVNILANNFPTYSSLEKIELTKEVEAEIDNAYGNAKTIEHDIENEQDLDIDTTEEIKNSIDKLMLVINIITIFVAMHSNHLAMESNQIESDKVEQLELINKNLEKINDYLHENSDLIIED